MPEAEDRFIKNLEAHIERTDLNLKYSIDRFDILIISISSGGLVFSMEFVKDLLTKKPDIDFLPLKISWVLFSLSIVLNLLSQVTGYYANKYEITITKNIIKQERNKPIKGNQNNLELGHKIFNSLTIIFNGLSLLFLISAIIILVIFMSITL